MQKEDLIRTLAEDCAPVRPLPHPAWRALLWFSVSLCYLAVVVARMHLRPDFAAKLTDSQYALEVAAAFLTSVAAAAGAFCAGSPGRPFWERLAPVPFLLIWIGAVVMMLGGALSLSDRRLRIGAPKPARARPAMQAAE